MVPRIHAGLLVQVSEFDIPNFGAIAGWDPQPPASLQYMCLVPLNLGHMKYGTSENKQTEHTGKLKVSITHRQQRLRDFKKGKMIGRNMLGNYIAYWWMLPPDT